MTSSNLQSDISKTIVHPIDQATKTADLTKTMTAGKRTTNKLPENQIPIFLDKYENKLIKKRVYEEGN